MAASWGRTRPMRTPRSRRSTTARRSERRMGRLDDKVCVVTGAAGGIGSATVEVFRREGATVVGVDLADGAPGDLALAVDVTDEGAVARMYARVRRELGHVDVLFNN